MKRLKILFIIMLLALILPVSLFAAGTVSVSYSQVWNAGTEQRQIVTINWLADSADATVPDTNIKAPKGWFLYSGETNPGPTSPTDDYDIVIYDEDGKDIADSLLLNRDATTTELVNIGTATFGYPFIRGNLTFRLSGNSVNSASGTVYLIFISN